MIPLSGLKEALDRFESPAGHGELQLAYAPAPLVPLESFLDLRIGSLLLWAPPTGLQVAGLGVAAEARASGPTRFADLKRETSKLWSRIHVTHPQGPPPPRPRLIGGLAFAPGAAHAPPWTSFGDACFILPRVSYLREAERAWLCLVHPGGVAPRQARAWLAELSDSLRTPSSLPTLTPRIGELRQCSTTQWAERIRAIHAGIDAGMVSKVVAARRARLTLRPAPCASAVLARLGEEAPHCTRFALQLGDSVFLGATPERLVEKRGNQVRADALAGTAKAGDHAPHELLSSSKEREEHQHVVHAIAHCIAPLCHSVKIQEIPGFRRLRHLLHLHTPIEGVLRAPTHLLDLAATLHPTPAVGGVPNATAIRWILEQEPDERGWYSGPLGWFDAEGNGEFAVALRCGLLRDQLAYLYAGAGIVRHSDADAEYAETRLKLISLLRALGVEI